MATPTKNEKLHSVQSKLENARDKNTDAGIPLYLSGVAKSSKVSKDDTTIRAIKKSNSNTTSHARTSDQTFSNSNLTSPMTKSSMSQRTDPTVYTSSSDDNSFSHLSSSCENSFIECNEESNELDNSVSYLCSAKRDDDVTEDIFDLAGLLESCTNNAIDGSFDLTDMCPPTPNEPKPINRRSSITNTNNRNDLKTQENEFTSERHCERSLRRQSSKEGAEKGVEYATTPRTNRRGSLEITGRSPQDINRRGSQESNRRRPPEKNRMISEEEGAEKGIEYAATPRTNRRGSLEMTGRSPQDINRRGSQESNRRRPLEKNRIISEESGHSDRSKNSYGNTTPSTSRRGGRRSELGCSNSSSERQKDSLIDDTLHNFTSFHGTEHDELIYRRDNNNDEFKNRDTRPSTRRSSAASGRKEYHHEHETPSSNDRFRERDTGSDIVKEFSPQPKTSRTQRSSSRGRNVQRNKSVDEMVLTSTSGSKKNHHRGRTEEHISARGRRSLSIDSSARYNEDRESKDRALSPDPLTRKPNVRRELLQRQRSARLGRIIDKEPDSKDITSPRDQPKKTKDTNRRGSMTARDEMGKRTTVEEEPQTTSRRTNQMRSMDIDEQKNVRLTSQSRSKNTDDEKLTARGIGRLKSLPIENLLSQSNKLSRRVSTEMNKRLSRPTHEHVSNDMIHSKIDPHKIDNDELRDSKRQTKNRSLSQYMDHHKNDKSLSLKSPKPVENPHSVRYKYDEESIFEQVTRTSNEHPREKDGHIALVLHKQSTYKYDEESIFEQALQDTVRKEHQQPKLERRSSTSNGKKTSNSCLEDVDWVRLKDQGGRGLRRVSSVGSFHQPNSGDECTNMKYNCTSSRDRIADKEKYNSHYDENVLQPVGQNKPIGDTTKQRRRSHRGGAGDRNF